MAAQASEELGPRLRLVGDSPASNVDVGAGSPPEPPPSPPPSGQVGLMGSPMCILAWAGLRLPCVGACVRGLRRWLLRAAVGLARFAGALPAVPLADDARDSAEVRRRINELHELLASAGFGRAVRLASTGRNRSKPVKIFIDGVFDLTHFGHMNAFRQARALGDYLIVGVNSDASVEVAKGLRPVLSDEERQAAVAGCRFVDEVLPASPYVMTEAYIEELIHERGVDYFVHGDDPCLVDGRDVYEAAKKAGRFRTIPRTDGISTTDIVGRLLLLTKDHHEASIVDGESPRLAGSASSRLPAGSGVFASQQSQFLVTSQLMQAFSAALPGSRSLKVGARAVYMDGAWDMFHAGHVDILRRARALGDYLVAGVHSDSVVNAHRGSNHPIMAMHERVLSVLGCRFVDDVLLDAPWAVTREMIATLNIAVVVRGTVRDCAECVAGPDDPHAVPQALGIHVELQSDATLSLEVIGARLQARRTDVCERLAEKRRKENDWFRQKHGLAP